MKKKTKRAIIGVLLLIAFVAAVLFISSNFRPFPQNVLGADSINSGGTFNLGSNSEEFFGYQITADIAQGVETYKYLIPSRCSQVKKTACGNLRCTDYYENVCTGGYNVPYLDVFYCSYEINISKDNQIITTKANTLNNPIYLMDSNDISLKLSGIGFDGAKTSWNTILDNGYYDPETGQRTTKQKCTGFNYLVTIKIPQDKMDLRLDNNTVIFENNWREIRGNLCMANNATKVITCFNNGVMPIGTTSAQFDLPEDSTQLLPMLKDVEIEGTLIGDLTGTWSNYEIKKSTMQSITAPETITNTAEIKITPLGNNNIQPIEPELKAELHTENFIQKFINWITSIFK